MSDERTPEQIVSELFPMTDNPVIAIVYTVENMVQAQRAAWLSRQSEIDQLKFELEAIKENRREEDYHIQNTIDELKRQVEELKECWLGAERDRSGVCLKLTAKEKEVEELKKRIRTAFAQYRRSEGCGCCESSDHDDHEKERGKLLEAQPFEDGSGYDWKIYIKP